METTPCLSESKPDPVLDGHLSPIDWSRSASLLKKAGALYPGLGEQRRQPCLRLQQVGVTAFHPVPEVRTTSLWPYPCGPLARTAPGLRRAPCSVLSGLSSPTSVRNPERPSFLQAAEVYPDVRAATR